MDWLWSIPWVGAIAIFYASTRLTDEVMQCTALLGASVCFLVGLVLTPWILKLVTLLMLLFKLHQAHPHPFPWNRQGD